MGIIRLYLAFCVVAAHTSAKLPFFLLGGLASVQVFYFISGFYMSLIMSKYSDALSFYISRALRIFPVYWAIALCVVSVSICLGVAFDQWAVLQPYVDHPEGGNGILGVVLIGMSNLTLFLQDLCFYFTDLKGEGIRFTNNFHESESPLYRYLVLPQSWTVAIELCFYLCIPFVCRLRTSRLLVLMVFLFSLRFYFYWGLGLANDPWTYRFLPFEFGVFLLGVLACRIYKSQRYTLLVKGINADLSDGMKVLLYFAVVGAALVFIERLLLPLEQHVGSLLFPLVVVLSMVVVVPFVFEVSKHNRWDRRLGELSYPVYLAHFFILYLMATYRKKIPLLAELSGETLTLICMLISALVSIPLVYFISNPIDRLRRRYRA